MNLLIIFKIYFIIYNYNIKYNIHIYYLFKPIENIYYLFKQSKLINQ